MTAAQSPSRSVLSLEQVQALLGRMPLYERMLFSAMIICGRDARRWTWADVIDHQYDLPSVLMRELRTFAQARDFCLGGPGAAGLALVLPVDAAVFAPASRQGETYAKPLTTQDANRRLKRYARMTGIDARISLHTLARTHRALIARYGMEQLSAWLGPVGIPAAQPEATAAQVGWTTHRDSRLRRIGQRANVRGRVG